MAEFDSETLDRWRSSSPRAVYDEVRDALYRQGATSSGDLVDAFEALVAEGLLTWEQIESFEDESQ